jgi:hypothetical protein
MGCVYLSNVLWTAVGVKSIFGVLYRFVGGRGGCDDCLCIYRRFKFFPPSTSRLVSKSQSVEARVDGEERGEEFKVAEC